MALCRRVGAVAPMSLRVFWGTTSSVRWKKNSNIIQDDTGMEWAKPIIEMHEKKQTEMDSDSVDTPKEPAMLHAVYRIQKLNGRPWWEKDIMKRLGLDRKNASVPAICKNTPYMNKLLREVKHLVEIVPITFPHGFPEHETDFEHTLLKRNGEFTVKKRLQQHEPESKDEEDACDKWRLDGTTIKAEMKRKLDTYQVHAEQFKAEYKYRYNQDGKERRYKKQEQTHMENLGGPTAAKYF